MKCRVGIHINGGPHPTWCFYGNRRITKIWMLSNLVFIGVSSHPLVWFFDIRMPAWWSYLAGICYFVVL